MLRIIVIKTKTTLGQGQDLGKLAGQYYPIGPHFTRLLVMLLGEMRDIGVEIVLDLCNGIVV
jgi:hypothetical protein